jgi:hypothetical protein
MYYDTGKAASCHTTTTFSHCPAVDTNTKKAANFKIVTNQLNALITQHAV